MNTRIFAAIATGAVLLSGCQKATTVAASGPVTGPAPVLKKNPCLLDTRPAAPDRCKRPHGGGQPVCRIVAIGVGDTAVVYPYALNVGYHGRNKKVTIIWGLGGEGEEFVQSKGDGPVDLLTDARFSKAWISKSPDGAASAPSGRYFRVDFENDKSTGPSGIAYDLQFSDADAKTVRCDPTINNQSG